MTRLICWKSTAKDYRCEGWCLLDIKKCIWVYNNKYWQHCICALWLWWYQKALTYIRLKQSDSKPVSTEFVEQNDDTHSNFTFSAGLVFHHIQHCVGSANVRHYKRRNETFGISSHNKTQLYTNCKTLSEILLLFLRLYIIASNTSLNLYNFPQILIECIFIRIVKLQINVYKKETNGFFFLSYLLSLIPQNVVRVIWSLIWFKRRIKHQIKYCLTIKMD